MKQHSNKNLRRALAWLLTVVMALSCCTAAFGVISFAAADSSTLVGRYFSTNNVWYDAVTNNGSGLQSAGGTEPSYNSSLGMTYLTDNYLRIANENLLSGVTRDTGVTFAFNYRPNFTGDHRHILSIGQNEYGNGQNDHFFISGATSWYSGGRFPVVAWMNGSSETIKAVPAGVELVLGKEYNIVVSVDKDKGVVFYIDGVKMDTVYVDSSKVHYSIPTGHLEFNHQFLVKYPESPKLVQLVTSNNTLELTFLKPDGLVRTERYTQFYPEVNHYNYHNNQLTYQRKPFFQRFELSPELMVRPLANMYDLNFGLKYKTRKIYYEIGLNSYYYPILGENQLGVTPYVRVGLTL